MPCPQCAHPSCKHGFARMGVMACPDCEEGTIVLDPVSHPRWRLDCNRCPHLVYLPPDLHTVKVTSRLCQVCLSCLPVRRLSCCQFQGIPQSRHRAGASRSCIYHRSATRSCRPATAGRDRTSGSDLFCCMCSRTISCFHVAVHRLHAVHKLQPALMGRMHAAGV